MNRNNCVKSILTVALVTLPAAASAGITLYQEGDRYLEIGGRLQPQYRVESPDNGSTTDDFFLRRMRFYIEGSVTPDWTGKWQVDFGGISEDPEIKDGYMRYTGWSAGRLTLGNHYVPFGRESQTSDKRQQLVERTFVGSSSFGAPERQMGLSLRGGERLQYGVGLYEAGIELDPARLDFESRTSDDAEYFGKLVAARLDFHPLGAFRMAQGDFERETRIAFAVNGYIWRNDDDDPTATPDEDYDRVTALGGDAAFRGAGLSVDVEYLSYATETRSNTFTGGLVRNGEGDFDTWAVEGGYMLVPGKLELAAGRAVLDADAFAEADTRTSVGVNWFFNRHRNKLQVTYEKGFDVDGIAGNDVDTLYLQFQHVI